MSKEVALNMAVPLGPCILCAVLMMIAGCVYAVNAALPAVDENELEKQVSGGDSGARRALRLLRRFDEGYGEIRMTYALLICAAFACLETAIAPSVAQWLKIESLAAAMLLGRIAWGITRFVIAGLAGTEFSFAMFLSGAFVQAVPGIICHIVLVPLVVLALKKAKLMVND